MISGVSLLAFAGLAEAAEPTLSFPPKQQNGEHSTVGELNR